MCYPEPSHRTMLRWDRNGTGVRHTNGGRCILHLRRDIFITSENGRILEKNWVLGVNGYGFCGRARLMLHDTKVTAWSPLGLYTGRGLATRVFSSILFSFGVLVLRLSSNPQITNGTSNRIDPRNTGTLTGCQCGLHDGLIMRKTTICF